MDARGRARGGATADDRLAPRTRLIPAERAELAGVAAITFAAAVLRFMTLHVQSFDEDEAVTVVLLHHSFGGMLSAIPHSEQTPPLYYALAWAWARVFGFDEVGLRSLSALAGTLLVPVMYAAGKRLVSHQAGLIAAALSAFSPFLFWYSQEARAYGLLTLFEGVAFLCFVHALGDRGDCRARARSTWCWGIWSALAMATHYFAAFLAAPQAALLVLRAGPAQRRSVLRALVVPMLAAVALTPLALYQRSPEKYAFIDLTPLRSRIVRLPRELLLGYSLPDGAAWTAAVLALMVFAGWQLTRPRSRDVLRRAVAPAAMLALFALLAPLLLALAGVDLVVTRNFIAVLVPCLTIAAIGFACNRAGVAAALVVCAVWLSALLVVASDIDYQRPPWRQAAAALGPARGPRLIDVVPAYRGAEALLVYLPGSGAPARGDPPFRELDVIAFAGASGGEPVTLSSRPPLPGFVEAAARVRSSYTVLIFRAARPAPLGYPVLQTLTAQGQPGPATYGALLFQR